MISFVSFKADIQQYAHMCHFFGNPLTVFLCDDVDTDELKPAHFEAFRSLPCFKQ